MRFSASRDRFHHSSPARMSLSLRPSLRTDTFDGFHRRRRVVLCCDAILAGILSSQTVMADWAFVLVGMQFVMAFELVRFVEPSLGTSLERTGEIPVFRRRTPLCPFPDRFSWRMRLTFRWSSSLEPREPSRSGRRRSIWVRDSTRLKCALFANRR